MLKHPQSVIKRDGQREPFQPQRMIAAVARAGRASGEFGDTEAERLADLTLTVLSLRQNTQPTVEQIQDGIEQTLLASGYFRSARAYILYREQHTRLRRDRQTMDNLEGSINAWLDRSEWRSSGVPQTWSLGGLALHLAGRLSANYWLGHVYPPEVEQAHRSGDLHLHALDTLAGYCSGWSLRDLLQQGLNGVPGQVQAGPPLHLASAIGQIVNFIGAVQNEWAGAQTLCSFDTWLAPYIRKDGLDYAQVRQCLQELVYNLNAPTRWGARPPFAILAFDWVCPADLRQHVPCIGGQALDCCLADLQDEMRLLQQAWLDVLHAGDYHGRPFVYPMMTVRVTPDFPWHEPHTAALLTLAGRYGQPWFINETAAVEIPATRQFAQRHQLDLNRLLVRGNGLYGSGELSGCVGMVTLNCARIGYLFRGDEAGLFRHIDRLLELARIGLEVKRSTVQRLLDQGLYPYSRRWLSSLRNHFSGIGVNGVNEMIRNFSADREHIGSAWGHAFALRLLGHMRQRLVQFQQQTGHLYSLEASPAEEAGERFARDDARRFRGMLQAGSDTAPRYSNSTQVAADHGGDLQLTWRQQAQLQQCYTGGAALALVLPEALSDAAACRQLLQDLLQTGLSCVTLTPSFSLCPSHGYLSGVHEFCPLCDGEREQRRQQHRVETAP